MLKFRTSLYVLVVVVLLLLLPRTAYGEVTPFPVLHFPSPSTVHTDTNPNEGVRLPPGYFVDEDHWKLLDTEVRRLQDSETRLGAENKSLRKSAEGWQPGWKSLGAAVLAGVIGGWYLHEHL